MNLMEMMKEIYMMMKIKQEHGEFLTSLLEIL